AGSPRWLVEQGIETTAASTIVERIEGEARTAILVARDGLLAGVIGVADALKPGSEDAVRQLRGLGLQVGMLTGDNRRPRAAIAEEAGIERVLAGVRPEGKAVEVRRLQGEGHVVAMVGDGVNDAPALAAADAGVALGTGSDAAIEAAAITLVKGDLRALPEA